MKSFLHYLVGSSPCTNLSFLRFIFLGIGLILTSCNSYITHENAPEAIQGTIDLREWDFRADGPVELRGAWEFHWQKLLEGNETVAPSVDHYYIHVPLEWAGLEMDDGSKLDHLGFASYRLRVLLPEGNDFSPYQLAIQASHASTSYRLSVFSTQGKALATPLEAGIVGKNKDSSEPLYRTDLTAVSNASEWILVYQVSNFHYFLGGPHVSPKIGTIDQLKKERDDKRSLDFFTIGVLIAMGIYHLILFLLYREDRAPLWFGLFCLSFTVFNLMSMNYIESAYPHLYLWEVYRRLFFQSIVLAPLLFIYFQASLFPVSRFTHAQKIMTVVSAIFSVYFLIIPFHLGVNRIAVNLFIGVLILAIGWIISILTSSVIRQRNRLAMIMLAGFVIFAGTVVHDLLTEMGVLKITSYLGAYGLIFFVISQSIANALKNQQAQLESYAAKKLKQLLNTLKLKHQELEEANSRTIKSIAYAHQIQLSILPDPEVIQDHLPDSFFIWEPRDIVSGDFYLFFPVKNGYILTVADCTGHGVPGGFMTMLAATALQRIVRGDGVTDPGEILVRLNRFVKRSLRQDTDNSLSDDGLEGAICFIQPEQGCLSFAGAGFPLLIAKENEVVSIKGDRQTIGYRRSPEGYRFKTQTVELNSDCTYYLFSDGLTDQAGGKKRIAFGKRRLCKLLSELHHLPMDDQKKHLSKALANYQGKWERRDDITVIGFRVQS